VAAVQVKLVEKEVKLVVGNIKAEGPDGRYELVFG